MMRRNIFCLLAIVLTVFAACEKKPRVGDAIHFTWQGRSKSFGIEAPNGRKYIVDYGDASVVIYSGRGDWQGLTYYYTDFSDYTVTIIGNTSECLFSYFECNDMNLSRLDVSGCSGLRNLNCYGNQIEILDIRKNTELERLNCADNRLIVLNLPANSKLRRLICSYNCLPLSELYKISKMISDPSNKLLGYQRLARQIVKAGSSIDYSAQKEFGGISTLFVVKKEGRLAIVNDDYTMYEGKITFNNIGDYEIIMTNDAIVSDENSPASVTAEITVSD